VRLGDAIRYPDAFVVGSPVARSATVVTNPVVLFEALSPSTASIDQFVKSREYRDTPSVQRYVMLDQDHVGATVFAGTDGDWTGHVLGADAVLAMPEIGIEVPLVELYEDVAVEDTAHEAGAAGEA
jgi:Uma2 family endonuclease